MANYDGHLKLKALRSCDRKSLQRQIGLTPLIWKRAASRGRSLTIHGAPSAELGVSFLQ
jgi:hypothetical protein